MLPVRFWGALGTEKGRKTVATLIVKTAVFYPPRHAGHGAAEQHRFSQVCRLGVFMGTFPTLEITNTAK